MLEVGDQAGHFASPDANIRAYRLLRPGGGRGGTNTAIDGLLRDDDGCLKEGVDRNATVDNAAVLAAASTSLLKLLLARYGHHKKKKKRDEKKAAVRAAWAAAAPGAAAPDVAGGGGG